MRNALKLFPLLFLLNLFSADGVAQVVDSSKMSPGWFVIGGGISVLGGSQYATAIDLGASYSHCFGKLCFQIGWDASSTFFSPTLLGNINFDVGKRYYNRHILMSAFIGPGYMWGATSDNLSTFHTIGINANVQFMSAPFCWFGVGVALFANVCDKEREAGGRIVFHFIDTHFKRTGKKIHHNYFMNGYEK